MTYNDDVKRLRRVTGMPSDQFLDATYNDDLADLAAIVHAARNELQSAYQSPILGRPTTWQPSIGTEAAGGRITALLQAADHLAGEACKLINEQRTLNRPEIR